MCRCNGTGGDTKEFVGKSGVKALNSPSGAASSSSESKEKGHRRISLVPLRNGDQKPKRGAGFGVEAGSEGGVGQVYDVFIGRWDE